MRTGGRGLCRASARVAPTVPAAGTVGAWCAGRRHVSRPPSRWSSAGRGRVAGVVGFVAVVGVQAAASLVSRSWSLVVRAWFVVILASRRATALVLPAALAASRASWRRVRRPARSCSLSCSWACTSSRWAQTNCLAEPVPDVPAVLLPAAKALAAPPMVSAPTAAAIPIFEADLHVTVLCWRRPEWPDRTVNADRVREL